MQSNGHRRQASTSGGKLARSSLKQCPPAFRPAAAAARRWMRGRAGLKALHFRSMQKEVAQVCDRGCRRGEGEGFGTSGNSVLYEGYYAYTGERRYPLVPTCATAEYV